VLAYYLSPFGYKLEVIHEQVIVTTDLPLSEDDKESYIRSVASNSLLYIQQKNGSPVSDFLTWSIVPDSKYEWRRGIIRFDLIYSKSKESFPAVLELRPSSLPRVNTARRMLQVPETNSNSQPKDYQIPTFYYISQKAQDSWFIGFCIIYILVILTMFFLICVRPFVKELRNSVRVFWFAQNVMWFQIIFFFGFIAIEFRGALDDILLNIARASLRYFGGDIEFAFISDIHQLKNGYYLGKYTKIDETPYVFQRMFVPMMCYFITFAISLFLNGTAKDILVAIRSGICYSYGVQFMFLCCLNFVAFFSAGVYNGYTVIGTLVALLLFIMIWLEVFMNKLHVQTGKPNFMSGEKNKGMSTYDIIGESNDKKIRDYVNRWLNEIDCLLLLAMFIGFLGRAMVAACVILLILGLLALVSVLIIKQQFKIWKILLAFTFILTFIIAIIFQGVGRDPSLDTAYTLMVIFLICYFLMLLFNIIIWILRLIDLLMPDYSVASETVILEKTPRKPKNEIVTYQKEEEVAKITKEEKEELAYVVNYDREIDDRSAYSAAYLRENRGIPAGERKQLNLMDESRSGLNASGFN
jgi:hypothetical protein